MIKKPFFGAYTAPVCETVEESLTAILCESPDATTEDFTEQESFSW